VQRRLAVLAYENLPAETLGPKPLAQLHKAEVEKWWPIIKASGIKGEYGCLLDATAPYI
jgi:hypothetical protein